MQQPDIQYGVTAVKAGFIERQTEHVRAMSSYLAGKIASVFAPPALQFTFGDLAPYNPMAAMAALRTSPEFKSAVEKRAMKLANRPIRVYQSDEETAPPVAESEPFMVWFRQLIRRPDAREAGLDFPRIGGFRTRLQLITDCIATGTAFAHVHYHPTSKKPIGFYRLPTEEMRFDRSRGVYYRYNAGVRTYYEAGTLAIIAGFATDTDMAFGVGAFEPIKDMIAALINGYKLAAKQSKQGVVAFVVSGEDELTQSALRNEKTRLDLRNSLRKMIESGEAFLIAPGNVKLSPVVAKAADLVPPELTKAGRAAIQAATNTTPIVMGDPAGNYASGVIQTRLQGEDDEAFGELICEQFFTNLARACALRFGYFAANTLKVELDFSDTVAKTSQRTDAMNRAKLGIQFGADPTQALAAEGIYNLTLVNPPNFGNAEKAPTIDSVPIGDGNAEDNGNTTTGGQSAKDPMAGPL